MIQKSKNYFLVVSCLLFSWKGLACISVPDKIKFPLAAASFKDVPITVSKRYEKKKGWRHKITVGKRALWYRYNSNRNKNCWSINNSQCSNIKANKQGDKVLNIIRNNKKVGVLVLRDDKEEMWVLSVSKNANPQTLPFLKINEGAMTSDRLTNKYKLIIQAYKNHLSPLGKYVSISSGHWQGPANNPNEAKPRGFNLGNQGRSTLFNLSTYGTFQAAPQGC